MLNKSLLPVLLIATIMISSCVSSKKYKSAMSTVDGLNAQISTLQQQVNELTATNKSLSSEYSSYKTDCEAKQKKYEEYRNALAEARDKMMEVQKALEAAEADFKEKGVDVYGKDGRVYVNMQDNLMYASGSSKLTENGKKALEGLASALNQYPNLQVIVVGHTDDVPFKKGINTDNMSLSTERANGVVRALRDDYSVSPERLVAAGQGKYAPVADNATAEGKAKNRRTEIILNPDLKRVWETAQ
ncbi:OmpA family protein [Chitinophagaceae bacterium LB-8]|uniref:OmpA family protein n=1 Tax=Paraflavisolibacter caeni TaxID=2982496 RepID=A0A9X3BHY8_9BACT|nr:OmpA family protein [Paraflavisolibacter caeni]MCU7549398.1 OmpA family protein [Paraflavisolibacter caeni]